MDFETTNIMDLVPPGEGDEMEQFCTKLNALALSAEGTLPGNRRFGLKREFLSRPPKQAKNIFAIELSEKAAIYMPEISIKSVDGEVSGDGMEHMTIHIERSGKQ